MEFFTIGVYNSTESDFFRNLAVNRIDTFCDIRQRRAVRGSKYSFVNSKRLQKKLKDMNINYFHFVDLAPTKEIRELQKKADYDNSELKKDRQELGKTFVEEFEDKILSNFDFREFFSKLREVKSSRIVLFCVEQLPQACHRSLVANKIHADFSYPVINL